MTFTKRFTDHSDAQGMQFEFHCDQCGKGVRSGRITSSMDLSSGLMGAAAALFGGFSAAGENLKKELGGKNLDHALAAAANEVRPKFTERGGLWICGDCASGSAQGAACLCGAPSTGSKFCPDCGAPRGG